MSQTLRVDFEFRKYALESSTIPLEEREDLCKERAMIDVAKAIKNNTEWEREMLPDRIKYYGSVHVMKVSELRDIIVSLKLIRGAIQSIDPQTDGYLKEKINEVIKRLNP